MAYIGRTTDGFGVRSRFIYTATGGQTTFTTDNSSNALSYSDGAYVDVYLNGVLLDPSDYTATSLTSIVLDSGATASDILEVIVYDVFSVFSGTFTNGITASEAIVTGDLTVDTNTLYVDSTNSRVGVGTSSPSVNLHIKDTDNNTQIRVENNDGIAKFQKFEDDLIVTNTDTGDIIIKTGTGETERLRVDSSGNVKINGGTLFPESTDSIRRTVDNSLITISGGDATNSGANYTLFGGTHSTLANIHRWRTDGSERMRIDSSGNVGVGTSSPDAPIEISRSNAGIIQYITNTGSGQAYTAYGNSDNPAWSQDFNTAGGLLVGIDSDETGVVYQGGNKALRFGTNAAERMRIDSAGVILQGSTSKTFGGIDATRLAVVGGSNSSSNAVQMIVDEDGSVEGGSTLLAVGFSADNSFSTANYINFFDSGGQQGRIEGTGAGAVSYQSGSDERLKSNIRDTASKWDALKQVQVRDFEWTADTSNTTVTGFIAQELHNIFPDAVSEGGEDVTKNAWTVDYGRTTPIIIKALQEAITKIETLEAKVTALENA